MREVGSVLVEELFVRDKPSSDESSIIGAVRRGDKLQIVNRRAGQKAEWLQIDWGRGHAWVAERNYESAERFVQVEPVRPDVPRPQPHRQKPAHSDPTWMRWVLAVVVIVVVLAVILSIRSAMSAPLPEPTASQRALCEPDANKFCRQFFPRKLRVLRCLKENRAQISPGCDALLRRYGQ